MPIEIVYLVRGIAVFPAVFWLVWITERFVGRADHEPVQLWVLAVWAVLITAGLTFVRYSAALC